MAFIDRDDYGMLAMISPTTRCNLSCRYCYVSAGKNLAETDMSLDDIGLAYKWISEYMPLVPSKKVEIEWFGGEPFLRGARYIDSAIEMQLQYFNPEVKVINRIQTNFTLIGPEHVGVIKDRFGGYISGSYDFGGCNRVFPNGIQASAKIEEKIDFLISAGIKLGVVCTLTRDNFTKIEGIYRFFRDRNIDFRVNRATRIPDPAVREISNSEYVKAVKRLFELYLSDENPPMVFSNLTTMIQAYLSGKSTFCVGLDHPELHLAFEAQGRLFSRCRFVDPIGNFNKESPAEILSKLKMGARTVTRPQACKDCRFWGAACAGPCFGEPDMDCLNSQCGYRGETSLELWNYVANFLHANGYEWGQFKKDTEK